MRRADRDFRLRLLQFSWFYRPFNYVAIMLGAMPPAGQRDGAEAQAHVMRTTKLFEAARRHFNRGPRAFFFALGYQACSSDRGHCSSPLPRS